MRVGEYVLVTKKDSDLYRRRCRITEVSEAGNEYKVYSVGLEQEEWVKSDEVEKSKW